MHSLAFLSRFHEQYTLEDLQPIDFWNSNSYLNSSSLIPSQSVIVNTKSVILSRTLSPSSRSSSPKGMSRPPVTVCCSFSTVPMPSIPTISLSASPSLSISKLDVLEAAARVPIPCSPVKHAEFSTTLRH